jgi:hypothetical protein
MSRTNEMPGTTSTGAAVVGWKLFGSIAGFSAVGAALGTYVVMCLTQPKTDREWRAALASSVVSSLGGGAALIMYLDLQEWAHEPFGIVAMLGISFACALPGWSLVRLLFAYMAKKATIKDVIDDIKR